MVLDNFPIVVKIVMTPKKSSTSAFPEDKVITAPSASSQKNK